mmetsp:Transcript_5263/g.9658  ORF Transcript_5263/g.9658 Transcript_5263/m.9658 type:complete len:206 (-) Transcript_5263:121-738(-)
MSGTQNAAGNNIARGRVVRVKKNPISKYNYVMLCHNTPYNRVDNTTLALLPRSRFYEAFFPLLRLKYCAAMILLGICPVLNALTWLMLFILWIQYERAAAVARSNAKLVSNPFSRMVYYPELCKHFGVMNKFLSLRMESFLSLDINLDLTGRTQDGFVNFMVYNDAFTAHYSMLRRFRWLHLLHLFQMSVLCGLTFYYIEAFVLH